MSTPGQEFRDAEYLGLGYMAVTSSELLDRVLRGGAVDDDEKHMLRKAKKFLEDVSSGARLVASGITSNVSAVESVGKFNFAVEPLKFMQDHIRASDVGETFPKFAAAIEATITANQATDPESLKKAKDFFMQLHHFLTSLTAARRRRSAVDFGGGAGLMGHA